MRSLSWFRSDYVGLLLVLLAALAHPLVIRLCADVQPALAVYLPSLVIVFWVCMLRPDPALPLLTLAAMYLVQLPGIIFDYGEQPCVVRGVVDGKWWLLGVPVAAAALGYAAVLARQKLPLWRWPMRSDIRLLARRPGVFIMRYRWPLLVLLVGATADMITTIENLHAFGPGIEVHPVMRVMAEAYGNTAGIAVGTLVRVLVVLFVAALWRRWCPWILSVCGSLYILAAFNNYYLWL